MIVEESTTVQGYHATTIEAAHAILESGFQISRKWYNWLGDGVYFFENAIDHARAWAQEECRQPAAILTAKIDLRNCIDLLDGSWSQLLTELHDEYLEMLLKSSKIPPSQDDGLRVLASEIDTICATAHPLDRAVINFTCERLQGRGFTVNSVRAAFLEGRRLYANSAFFDKTHVQLAVRNPSAITDLSILEVIK